MVDFAGISAKGTLTHGHGPHLMLTKAVSHLPREWLANEHMRWDGELVLSKEFRFLLTEN